MAFSHTGLKAGSTVSLPSSVWRAKTSQQSVRDVTARGGPSDITLNSDVEDEIEPTAKAHFSVTSTGPSAKLRPTQHLKWECLSNRQ